MPVDDQQVMRLMDKLDRIAESLGEVRGQLQASQRNFEDLNNKTGVIANRMGLAEQSVSNVLSDIRLATKRLDGVDTVIAELKLTVRTLEQDRIYEQGERSQAKTSFTLLEKVLAALTTFITLYLMYKGH